MFAGKKAQETQGTKHGSAQENDAARLGNFIKNYCAVSQLISCFC